MKLEIYNVTSSNSYNKR